MADYMSIFKASQTPNYMNIFHAAQSGQYAAQQQAEQRAQADAAYQQAAKQFSQHVQASQQLEQQQENARAQMMQNLSGLETRPSLLTTEAQPDTVFKQAALAKLNATQAQNRAQNIQNIKQQMGLTGNTPITQAQNNLIKSHLAAQNGDQMAKLYEKIGAFGSGAEDALTLNTDKLGNQPLSGEMNYDATKNPGLYNAGQMAGTLPSMLIGGGELSGVKGVSGWAGDSVAKKALVNAASGALSNGAYTAAANVAPVISGKESVPEALRQTGYGAVMGAGIGGALGLAGAALAKTIPKTTATEFQKAVDTLSDPHASESELRDALDTYRSEISKAQLENANPAESVKPEVPKITPDSEESATESFASASHPAQIDQSQFTRYSPENVKKVMDNVSPNFDKLNASNLSANAVRTSDALANALDAAKGVDDPDVTELLSTAKASVDTAASDLDRIDRQYFGGNGGDIDALPEDVKAQAQTAMDRISTARSALKDYLGIDLNDYFLPKGFSLGEKYDPIKAGDYKFSAPVRANLGDLEHVDTSEINPNFTDNAVESMQTPKGATQLGRDLRASYSGKENLQLTKGNQLRDIVRGATGGSGKEGDATRRAVSWYLDAKGDTPEAKRAYLQSVLDDKDMRLNPYRDDIQRAMNLPANAQKTADELARYYGEMGAYSESLNTIHNFKDNYAPRIWEKSGGNTTTEMFNKGLSTYTHHSQNRVFDNLADGIKAGYTPKTLDAGDLLSIYNSEMSRVNTNRSLADGLARAGVGGYENGKIKDGWTEVPSLSKKIAVVDKDGNAKIVNRKFLMPKELAKHLNAISEIDHIKAVAPLRGVLSFNQAVKTAELSLSAFHDVTMVSQALYNNAGGIEFIRHLNLMHSTNSEWFQDAEQFAAKMGVTTAKNADNIDVFMHLAEQNGTKAQLLKQPVIKQIVGASEAHTNFLFGTIQRWLKVTDFSMKAADWDAKHIGASEANRISAMRSIAEEVNAAYGGLNWKSLGISPSVRSFMHVGLLAPDWTTSSVLSVGQAFTKGAGGTAARRNLVFGLLGSALLGEGLNKILTGHFTDKNSKGHELDIEVSPNVYISPYRSGIGDLAKWIGNTARFGAPAGTVQTISNKESPFLKTLTGLTSNRDYYGSQIYNQKNSAMKNTANIANYLLSEDAPVPFGVESLPKVAKDTTLSTPQKVLAGTLAGTGTGTYSKSSATAGEPYAGNWLYGLTPQGRAENELNQKYTAFTKAQSAATKAKEAKSASYQAKKAAEAKYTEQVKHYMGLSKKGRAMYYNALTPAEKAALNAQLQQSGGEIMQSGTTSFDQVKCSGLSVQGGGRKLLSLSGANNQERASVAQDGTLLAPMGTYPTSNNGTAYSATIPGYVPGRVYYVQLSAAISATSTLSVNGGAACELDDMTGTAISKASANAVLPVFQPDAVSNFLCLVKGGASGKYSIGSTITDMNLSVSVASGKEVWARIPSASCISIDPQGNVYVSDGYIRYKYDSNGNLLSQVSDILNAMRMVIDKHGYIYEAYRNTSGITVKKMNSDGSLIWSPPAYIPMANSIAVDYLGNIYVAYLGNQIGNITVNKYDPDGTLLWNLSDITRASSISVDNSGNVYVGYLQDTGAVSLRKLDTNGNQLWDKTDIGYVNDIAVDKSGNVYVATQYLFKYDPSGTLLWQTWVGPVSQLAVDSQNNIYIALNISTGSNVVKFNSTGTQSTVLATDINVYMYPIAIAVDNFDNVYVGYNNMNESDPLEYCLYKLAGCNTYTITS